MRRLLSGTSAYLAGLHSGPLHHRIEDLAIEHSGNGNAVGGSLHARGSAHGVDKCLTMVRTRSPDQRAIDIEQDQCICLRHLLI